MLMRRVMMYVDGFNLYYGLKSKGWKRYYWLDIRRMAERMLRPDQELVAVRYFTAAVQPRPNDPGKPVRQRAYLEALATLRNLRIHYGYFSTQTATLLDMQSDLADLRGKDDGREHRGRNAWRCSARCL